MLLLMTTFLLEYLFLLLHDIYLHDELFYAYTNANARRRYFLRVNAHYHSYAVRSTYLLKWYVKRPYAVQSCYSYQGFASNGVELRHIQQRPLEYC